MNTLQEWYPVLLALTAIAVIAILFVFRRLFQKTSSLRDQLEELSTKQQSQEEQMQIMHESLLEMGRHIISLDERVSRLRQNQSLVPTVRSDHTEEIMTQLDEGQSVEQIAATTGLEEVEVSLLKQIHGARDKVDEEPA